MCLRKSAFERILRARDEEDGLCRTCDCGDVDEYADDLAELAEDDPAWACALAREDDLSVTEDDGSGQEQEDREEPHTDDNPDDEPDDGNDWFVG